MRLCLHQQKENGQNNKYSYIVSSASHTILLCYLTKQFMPMHIYIYIKLPKLKYFLELQCLALLADLLANSHFPDTKFILRAWKRATLRTDLCSLETNVSANIALAIKKLFYTYVYKLHMTCHSFSMVISRNLMKVAFYLFSRDLEEGLADGRETQGNCRQLQGCRVQYHSISKKVSKCIYLRSIFLFEIWNI